MSGNPGVHFSGDSLTQEALQMMIAPLSSIFGELFINPSPPITTPPDPSKHEPPCYRSPWENDLPKVPHMGPCRSRLQRIFNCVVRVDDHSKRPLREQSRQAEYNRLTALPVWARTFGEIIRCSLDSVCTGRRNETPSLSLMSALRVNCGQARGQKLSGPSK